MDVIADWSIKNNILTLLRPFFRGDAEFLLESCYVALDPPIMKLISEGLGGARVTASASLQWAIIPGTEAGLVTYDPADGRYRHPRGTEANLWA
jgi:hypothetical protein